MILSTVIVEREFVRPVNEVDLRNGEDSTQWCMDLYGVQPRCHYLSIDGRRAVCVFSAPDADALRQTALKAGYSLPRRIWSCAESSGREAAWEPVVPGIPGFELVVMVCEFEHHSDLPESDVFERLMDSRASTKTLRLARRFLSIDRRRVLCLFEAPDEDSVRRGCKEAGIEAQAIWKARTLIPRITQDQ